MATYKVKSGDTLSGIAKANDTTIAILKALNPTITNVNIIRVGQVINLPSPLPVTPAPEPTEKDYAAIGQKVEKCISAIEKLPEFLALENLFK